MNNDKIEVHFTHPRNANSFTAFINPQCTGQKAVQGLMVGDENGAFLEPAAPGRPYELAIKRSGTAITPNMTFADAGVMDGEVIEVRQAGQGASAQCRERRISTRFERSPSPSRAAGEAALNAPPRR